MTIFLNNVNATITGGSINANITGASYVTRHPSIFTLSLSTAPETVPLTSTSTPFRTAIILNTGASSVNIGTSTSQNITIATGASLVLTAEGTADQLDLSNFYVYSDNTGNSLAVLYW
ncbi:MAG: hypothetical protein QXL94_05410 [Candidatus Parvarchaeum sp.]